MSNICVFCGSQAGQGDVFATSARQTAQAIVQRGYGIVYGGGHVGLMGILADAALAAGGEVIGVIPQALADREVAHRGLTQLHVVNSMHERKALMAELSVAFIALPGGYGTLDELCEVITWTQLGIHDKAIGLLNVQGFFDHFLAQLESAVVQGFISPENRRLLSDSARIDDLLAEICEQPSSSR